MALETKVELFKKHFNIESSDQVEFKLDTKENLIAVFEGKDNILTNARNKNKFLSYDTMKLKKNYGCDFLHAIKLEAPKKQIDKKYTQKEMMIFLFKCVNLINKDFDLDSITFVQDNELYTRDDDYINLFSDGRPHQMFNLRPSLLNKLGIPNDIRLPQEAKESFTDEFLCNVPNKTPNKDLNNEI